ncbi:MAG: hypothetical protein KHW59_04810 [Clostridiales bacterium]|nr:hypothetical protein [Clostridiales bacterium]
MVENKLKHEKNKFGNIGETIQKYASVAFQVAVIFIIIWTIISVFQFMIMRLWESILPLLVTGFLLICAAWLAWALISCFAEISIQLTRIADRGGKAGWKVQSEEDRKAEEKEEQERAGKKKADKEYKDFVDNMMTKR